MAGEGQDFKMIRSLYAMLTLCTSILSFTSQPWEFFFFVFTKQRALIFLSEFASLICIFMLGVISDVSFTSNQSIIFSMSVEVNAYLCGQSLIIYRQIPFIVFFAHCVGVWVNLVFD
jgi:hypothetical protein